MMNFKKFAKKGQKRLDIVVYFVKIRKCYVDFKYTQFVTLKHPAV